MLYPLYVHHEPGSAWSGEFPDMPGCFTAADKLDDLPAAAQEAVTAHYHFDDDSIPAASTPEHWQQHPDYQGGFWLMVDIDLSRVRTPRSVRLNISLPESLAARIDSAAKQRGQSRSAFLASAATQAMQTT